MDIGVAIGTWSVGVVLRVAGLGVDTASLTRSLDHNLCNGLHVSISHNVRDLTALKFRPTVAPNRDGSTWIQSAHVADWRGRSDFL